METIFPNAINCFIAQTSFEKDGMKGSSKQARRYTRPAEVFITVAHPGGSSL